MKDFSNKYIFIYATVLVLVVAAVLATTATLLKPFQIKNVNTEKVQNLLAAINVEASFDEAETLYKEYFKEELGINKEGNVVDVYNVAEGKMVEGTERPFAIDVKKQQSLLKEGQDVVFPLYVYEKDGQKGYVIPLQGAGLWGDIWGNIALASDFNTVVGVNFDHAGETPGLGAEITTKGFQDPFIGKHIYDAKGNFTSVIVKKNADATTGNEVDAISGGTITSVGVSDMLRNDLNFYQNYRNKIVE